ncbi:MAG: DUF892 family protein [Brumimicrobium sp.]
MESKNSNSMTLTYGGKYPKRKREENPLQSSNLMRIFEGLLKDIYWSEKALIEVIPKVTSKVSSPEMISSLTSHNSEIENQVKKMEGVFRSMEKEAAPRKSEDMKRLIRNVGEIMETEDFGLQCDLKIIFALQKIQHYKISSYAALSSFAKTLDENDAVTLLEQAFNVERETDKRLNKTAQLINYKIVVRNRSV